MTIPLPDILVGVFSTTLALAPFYMFAGMGEIVSEQAGVANLGV